MSQVQLQTFVARLNLAHGLFGKYPFAVNAELFNQVRALEVAGKVTYNRAVSKWFVVAQ